MCPQPPPPDRQYCNVLDCPVRWHSGEWSKCSKTCGGGVKQRDVSVVMIVVMLDTGRVGFLLAALRVSWIKPEENIFFGFQISSVILSLKFIRHSWTNKIYTLACFFFVSVYISIVYLSRFKQYTLVLHGQLDSGHSVITSKISNIFIFFRENKNKHLGPSILMKPSHSYFNKMSKSSSLISSKSYTYFNLQTTIHNSSNNSTHVNKYLSGGV